MKKTLEIFKKELFQLVNDKIEVIDDKYINNKTPIKVKCNKCGHIWKPTPNNLLSKKQLNCPNCESRQKVSEKMKKDSDWFLNRLKEKNIHDIILIEPYNGTFVKIKFKCNKCGHIWSAKPNNILNGSGCPNCAMAIRTKYFNDKKRTQEEWENILKNNGNNEYISLSPYINAKTKTLIKHLKCGNQYEIKPNEFIHGNNRCPFCKQKSKGEVKIKEWLLKNNIDFEEQYVLPDCKFKRKLSFDFKMEDDTGKIILVEYDGEQHYKPKFNNSNDEFKIQKQRDYIKDEYCKDNNIDLYRISYKYFNKIETILEEIINFYN